MARILIVADDQMDRTILGFIVKRTGHEVYFESDGEQAFEVYVRRSIEIVITDLHMPRVDGLEFIESFLTLYPDAPIIAVSGKGPDLLAEAKRKGALVALSKPIDPHELVEALAKTELQVMPRPLARRGDS